MATSAASAFAEWTKVDEVDGVTFYIDYTTIRKDGNDYQYTWFFFNLAIKSNHNN